VRIVTKTCLSPPLCSSYFIDSDDVIRSLDEAAKESDGLSDVHGLTENHGSECLTEQTGFSHTAVHLMAKYQDEESVQFICDKLGSEALRTPNANGKTPFHFASLNNTSSASVLRMMLQFTDDSRCLTVADHKGWTPANLAAKWADAQTLHLIEENLGLLWYRSNPEFYLHQICFNSRLGSEPLLSALTILEVSVDDVNQMADSRGRSPLFQACLGKNFDVVQQLYQADAVSEVKDKDGNTLLHAMFQMLPLQKSRAKGVKRERQILGRERESQFCKNLSEFSISKSCFTHFFQLNSPDSASHLKGFRFEKFL
jgi:ankyrin repeat protein